MSSNAFPFTALRQAGSNVKVLHQIGKCAVAKVTSEDNKTWYYAVRFRQFHAKAGSRAFLPDAFAELRRLDNAEIRRDNEVLTGAVALDQLQLDPSCFGRFCQLHGLDIGRSYSRRELRRAITSQRQPKMPLYLDLLNKLTPSTVTNKA